MIESKLIVSLNSDTPLAEFRTDGHKLQFVHDISEGELPEISGGTLQGLMQAIDRSSHLRIVDTPHSTVGKLGFILESGDTVEITTDGKTATLNDELMSEEEMNHMFESISNGELNVSYRSHPEDAQPLVPPEEPPPEG